MQRFIKLGSHVIEVSSIVSVEFQPKCLVRLNCDPGLIGCPDATVEEINALLRIKNSGFSGVASNEGSEPPILFEPAAGSPNEPMQNLLKSLATYMQSLASGAAMEPGDTGAEFATEYPILVDIICFPDRDYAIRAKPDPKRSCGFALKAIPLKEREKEIPFQESP